MVLQVCVSFCKVSRYLFFHFVFFVFVFFCFILKFFLLLYFSTLREQNPYFLALCKKNNPDFFGTSQLFWHFARTLTWLLQFRDLQECELLRRFGLRLFFLLVCLHFLFFLFFFFTYFFNFYFSLFISNFFETLRLSSAICKNQLFLFMFFILKFLEKE